MKTIYVAHYHDSMYPEDNGIIGAAMTLEGAQALIDETRMTHHCASSYHYSIEETQLHD